MSHKQEKAYKINSCPHPQSSTDCLLDYDFCEIKKKMFSNEKVHKHLLVRNKEMKLNIFVKF